MNEITNILLEDVIRERRESELFQSDENDQSSSHVEKENMTLLTSAGPNNEITKIGNDILSSLAYGKISPKEAASQYYELVTDKLAELKD